MTDSSSINSGLDVMALSATPTPSAGGGQSGGGSNSWFEAVAGAWGSTLDNEAQRIVSMSNQLGGGSDQPSQIAQLSAESLRMSFLSNGENTSLNSIGDSLGTMARKS